MLDKGTNPRVKFPSVRYTDACAVGANRDLAFETEAFSFAWNQTTRLTLRNISGDFLIHLYTKEPDLLWLFSNLKLTERKRIELAFEDKYYRGI